MNNLYRTMTIFVQNRFNFSIGFTQLSNLFQPFSVGSNQCLASYGLFHCFFTGFQQFFQSIVTMGCHQLFNLFHKFQHQLSLVFFFPFFGKDFKRSSLFKSALSGARSDQLPCWDDFVRAIFFQFYAVLCFL